MAQSEGQELVGYKHRHEFVNLKCRKDRALAQSPSLRVAFVHSNHITHSHSVSLRHVPRDQEMHDLKVEVHHLWQRLRQRVHIRESRNRSPSLSSNSIYERSYR